MPRVWYSLKKSLPCKSEPSEVHDPKAIKQFNTILTRKIGRSGCSRSIANLKDVIHGSKRHIEQSSCGSPRSIGSSEFINPITHEVILSNSKCELKITGYGGFEERIGSGGGGSKTTFVGTLKPGTPGPGGPTDMHYFNNPCYRDSSSPPRKSPFLFSDNKHHRSGFSSATLRSSHRVSLDADVNDVSTSTCHKCGEKFSKWDAAEAHHLSKHAVTELAEGESSRKIVEIICRTSWLNSEHPCCRIQRILKVHNMQKTLAIFEEYRESVKIKASKLSKKHPRCLADGNELLRFYGTTVTCLLGANGSSNLCISERCRICQIIRNGFSGKKELKDEIGTFTTSTSGRAFENIEILDGNPAIRKALIVCRVIAGRVHRPLDNIKEIAGQTGFDSLAGKVGLYSNIEELYLLNPRALLPCFVVICKP